MLTTDQLRESAAELLRSERALELQLAQVRGARIAIEQVAEKSRVNDEEAARSIMEKAAEEEAERQAEEWLPGERWSGRCECPVCQANRPRINSDIASKTDCLDLDEIAVSLKD